MQMFKRAGDIISCWESGSIPGMKGANSSLE